MRFRLAPKLKCIIFFSNIPRPFLLYIVTQKEYLIEDSKIQKKSRLFVFLYLPNCYNFFIIDFNFQTRYRQKCDYKQQQKEYVQVKIGPDVILMKETSLCNMKCGNIKLPSFATFDKIIQTESPRMKLQNSF